MHFVLLKLNFSVGLFQKFCFFALWFAKVFAKYVAKYKERKMSSIASEF